MNGSAAPLAKSGSVIWMSGLSGAGKTTLCNALWSLLKERVPELVRLDGDAIRNAFGNDLSHCEADRIVQVKRVRGLARELADQGLVVLVAVLYMNPELYAWNRDHLPGYLEVHLKASLETVKRRDPKGLYAAAAAGRMPNVVGIDIPWHAPESPDIVLDMDNPEPPDVLARRVAAAMYDPVCS